MTKIPCGAAEAADGSPLDVQGFGILQSIEIWGHEFCDMPVKVLSSLPSKLIFGLSFWVCHDLNMDLKDQVATIHIDGRKLIGSIWICKGSEDTEALELVEEQADIIQQLRETDISDFSPDFSERKALQDLLFEFRDLFYGIGHVKGVQNRINLVPDAVPVALPTRRRSPAQEDAERAEVVKLLNNGVMEPSVSPWAAANVFVPKKSGGLRTTTDFRMLNNLTVTDTYPMEDARATLDWLGGKKVFSTFDLKDGFFQVELAEESRPLTAVRMVMGLVQYRRLPQGLKNSPATFQRIVNATLGDMKGLSVLAYMDDVSVGTQTAGDHLVELRKVPKRVRDSGMKLKLPKCHFGTRSVEILGHHISQAGILPSKEHLSSISNLREPTDGHSLLRFLGLANYFSGFIEDFSNMSKPLYDVFQGCPINKKKIKHQKVHVPGFEQKWGKAQSEAWKDIRDDLSLPTIMIAPNRHADKMLLSDASSYGVGAVLLQKDDSAISSWRPIAFTSRKLKGAETRYTVTEQECLAVVFALKKWRHYLHGGPCFQIVTDHLALKWLMSLKDPKGRLARWMVEIQDFDYEINHAPGSSLSVPDCLSRDSVEKDSSVPESVMSIREPDGLPSVQEFLKAQEKEFGDLGIFVQNTNDHIQDEDGLLYVKQKNRVCVVVPFLLHNDVLNYVHGSVASGHFGIAKTFERAESRFWWPTMAKDIRSKVKGCVPCELSRSFPVRKQGKIAVYHPNRRFEIVPVDVLEISPTTARGKKKVVVIGDAFTRFMWAYPISDESISTISKVILEEWILRFGVPEKLLSDKGKSFSGKLVESICKLIGIKKIFTSAYHPQTDGMVERFNRTLCKDLASFVFCEEDWDILHISIACFRYNTSVNLATKITPYRAMFGVEAFDFDNEVGWRSAIDGHSDEDLESNLKKIHEMLYRNGCQARHILPRTTTLP